MELQSISISYNDTPIPCPIEEGHRMIPVKTVCTIIDIDFPTQDAWLKAHPYYSQLYRLSQGSSADNKLRDMNCLPIFDVLSWLASLSPKNRKAGSMEKQYAFMIWLRTQMLDMYKLIELIQQENKYELELIEKKSQILEQMEETNMSLAELKKSLKQVNHTIEDIRSKRFTAQTALPFPEN